MTDIKTYLETETELPVADTAFDRPQKLPFVAFIDKTAQDGDDFHARIVEHNLMQKDWTTKTKGSWKKPLKR